MNESYLYADIISVYLFINIFKSWETCNKWQVLLCHIGREVAKENAVKMHISKID